MAGRPSASTASTTTRSPPRSSGAQTQRPPEPHRLPHDHRLRRADQGRHRRGARQPARRRGDQGRQGAAAAGNSGRSSSPTMSAPSGGRPARAAPPCGSEWEQRLAAAPADKRGRVRAPHEGRIAGRFRRRSIAKVCDEFRAKNAKIATRQASGAVLDALVPAVPELIGGSADLTPSNNTKAKDEADIKPGDFAGRYIRFGVREHGMAVGDERHRRAWRAHPLWRHLPDLHRLRPAGDPAVGADGGRASSMS